MDMDEKQTRYLCYVGAAIGIFLWLFFVVLAFYYFARCAFTSGEKFKLSLLFAIATIFCPPFCSVPICLNMMK